MFDHVPGHQLALKHTSHFPPKWVSCCTLQSYVKVVNWGVGGGQKQSEVGWANRQTLKVTIPISHQISRTPVITAYSWAVPTLAQGISSIWPCDSLDWNTEKISKWHSLITMILKCSVPLIACQDMFHVAVSLTRVLKEKDLSLDLISLSQCKHCSLSSPFCNATSHNTSLRPLKPLQSSSIYVEGDVRVHIKRQWGVKRKKRGKY